ncbi:bifunctional 4-hydroxy-2-oxoglutarate aldolase/2-dehydro-3-deoxy-phosphogluconate aldolase [Streptomyces sp. SCSIO 75703]|uniref:bifunctional 4-hydroxy-2-oxoglutarate aldolase/2-dehydro-3-deoxy-phosphogluconate aldolase n=1 Tax=unclassified Streptomyces TaxID=2593676 RepID=UPI0004BE512A|nr:MULTISPECIES: bifunctional 4-hydroxy-2-oxoglutarate aldolase/2-dehydro-3-deoxy-phosphogluconate aldolase [unclassified Streptomyces]
MTFTDRLRRERVIAIVRGTDPKAAERTVHTLREEGVALIEVSLTTPDAAGIIARCARAAGDALIGAGTVLTGDDAREVQQAGAAFVVTPALAEGSATAHALGLPVVAGALTPTEVVRAVDEGATAVKLFPASVGGPDYLRALRDPLPGVPFVPTGGVDATAARAYLEAGAVAVGVGSPIVGDAPRGGDPDALRERCRAFLGALAGHRERA